MGQYLIDLPDNLHRELKVRAAQEGTTVKQLLIEAVEQFLKTAKKKGAKP
jgi:plasmid stability protein